MALREPSEGSLLRVLRPGGCAAHLFEALQASDGTPHVGMVLLRPVPVLFQLGVEVQDRLGPLPNEPGARVG